MTKPLYHAKIMQTVAVLLMYQFILYLVPFAILSYCFRLGGISTEDLFLQIFSSIIGFLLLLFWLSRKYKLDLIISQGMDKYRFQFFIPMFFSIIGLDIVISELGNRLQIFLPLDPTVSENLMRLFEIDNGLFKSFFLVVILTPVLEEIVFRGLILRGFLQHYPVKKAIFASAVLFGLYHMNLWQFLGAFAWGIMAGWWLIKTRSLIYCVIGHALMNGIGFIMMLLKNFYNIVIPGFTSNYDQLVFQPTWFTVMGLISFAGGSLILTKMFNKNNLNII